MSQNNGMVTGKPTRQRSGCVYPSASHTALTTLRAPETRFLPWFGQEQVSARLCPQFVPWRGGVRRLLGSSRARLADHTSGRTSRGVPLLQRTRLPGVVKGEPLERFRKVRPGSIRRLPWVGCGCGRYFYAADGVLFQNTLSYFWSIFLCGSR